MLFEYWYEAVDVTGTHGDHNVGAEGYDEVTELFLAAKVFVHVVDFAQYHSRRDTWDGTFAGGIDREKYNFVEWFKGFCKFVGKVAGASVEVRLKDADNPFSWV